VLGQLLVQLGAARIAARLGLRLDALDLVALPVSDTLQVKVGRAAQLRLLRGGGCVQLLDLGVDGGPQLGQAGVA
jgi:hypothetical protein